MSMKPVVDWNYEGKSDYSFGTGAYREEKWIGWTAAVVIPIVLLIQVAAGIVQWNVWQTIVAVLIAFDIGGGLVCNALNSCKRFYHSPLKPNEGRLVSLFKNHLLFSMLHVHPIAVGLLYGGGDWFFGVFWYGLYMISAMIVLKVPLYIKRPVAMGLIMMAILANESLPYSIHGFGWLIPLLFLKIIYGHLVREEPYRKSIHEGSPARNPAKIE